MRLSLTRRGDYAVRAMLALATDRDDDWLSVSRISGAMDIPGRFLPRVLTDLVAAGLVEGRTGRTGGYRLARPARGHLVARRDRRGGLRTGASDLHPARRALRFDGRCAVHDAFTEARRAMTEQLATVSLADVDGAALD